MAPHHRDPARTFWGWNDVWLAPAFRNWNITDRLASITAPALILQGKDDEYGSAAQVDAIAARVGRVESLFIDACGHSPHRSAPEMVLDATARFLAALPQA
jgi:pimeloyl-ACP methyl ester carboxylesterase